MPEIIKIKYQRSFKVPAINPSESYFLPIPDADKLTHNFFNDLTITNMDSVDLEIFPDDDQDRSFYVPTKVEKSFTFNDDNMKYTTLRIKNLSAATATTANKIQVLVIKKRKENTTE